MVGRNGGSGGIMGGGGILVEWFGGGTLRLTGGNFGGGISFIMPNNCSKLRPPCPRDGGVNPFTGFLLFEEWKPGGGPEGTNPS